MFLPWLVGSVSLSGMTATISTKLGRHAFKQYIFEIRYVMYRLWKACKIGAAVSGIRALRCVWVF